VITGGGGAALRAEVRRARELNERNARLMTPRLNLNQARLEVLFGGGPGRSLYLSDGRAAQPQHRMPQRGVRA
jgi:flagellar biosynthesis/type III secretory pathway chaperone